MDVKILIKEVVFNSGFLSIFVDSFISGDGKVFSSVDIDLVGLIEGTL